MVERTAPSTPGSRAADSEAASDLAARSSNCRTVTSAPAGLRSGSACTSRSLTRKLLIAWARALAASAARRSRSIRARDWPSRTVLTASTTTAVWSSPAPMATPVRCLRAQRSSRTEAGARYTETGSSAAHRSTSSARARQDG